MLLGNNLSFQRNNKMIFHKVDISLSPGKIILLTGKNGSGKTTLIKVLTNILFPNTGEIFWNGQNIKKNIFNFYKNVSLIMDTISFNNNLTVKENIFFWKKLYSSPISKKEINKILEILSISQYENTPIKFLSNGERKKLDFSRLIIEQKKLWILDEPYLGLDKDTADILDETFINHIEKDGMIIFASHNTPDLKLIEKINLENYAYI